MNLHLAAVAAIALVGSGVVELVVPAAAPAHAEADHPEAKPYDEHRNAMAAVDAALERAAAGGKRLILVMGANWCHDSRGLAGWLETPRFAALVEPHFETVFIDAGEPREDKANNMEVAERFGVDELIGTPNVFILEADGTRLNSVEDVLSWRDAASRDEDEIYDYFKGFIPPLPAPVTETITA